MPDFADLGLAAPLLGALATEGYTTPTPIQSRAIPTVLGGRDLCGIARTGSGKTAAFALPILQRVSAAPQRQTLLFSATMPRSIAALAEDFLIEPVTVAVTPPATTVQSVEQEVVFVSSDRKRDLLTAFLRDPAFKRVLVFTRTKHGADRVVRHLVGADTEATTIHGNKSQPQCERSLANFRDGRARVLVATDIAARGIDVDGVSHVINFDLPNVPEDYVHRIGRTARARHCRNWLPSAAELVPYGGRPQIAASAERKREPPVRYRHSCSSAWSACR